MALFLSISPNQTKFLPSVCLVPGLDFSAILVLISAVSLGRISTRNGKKTAKFLMRTFTFRSTFLYASHLLSNLTQLGISKTPASFQSTFITAQLYFTLDSFFQITVYHSLSLF
jgi:hypothetical protein